MTFKDRLCKLFDVAAAPARITDRDGQDAYATNDIARFMSRPEMMTTLLGTTSVLGLQVATGVDLSSFLTFMRQSAFGYGAYLVIVFPNSVAPVLSSIPTLYFDRTRKADPLNPLTPHNRAYLIATKERSVEKLISFSPLYVGLTAVSSLGGVGTLCATAFTLMISHDVSRYWRARQALEGNWRVLEQLPPKQEEKIPAPLGAQGAMHFTPAS